MPKPAHKKDGFVKREPKEFDEEVIQIDRVTRVVKGGRKLRFRATVAIGNRKGKVGIGIGKSNEVQGAIQKAINKAKKDLFSVTMDGSTIPHQVYLKLKSSRLLLMPAVPGTGLIAGGTIRKVLDLAGIKDVMSKSFGTNNKLNNTKAAFAALHMLKTTPMMTRRAARKAAAIKKATPTPAPAAKAPVTPEATAPVAVSATPADKPAAPAHKPAVKPTK
ncbi:30S ribosomal protein S5 [Candidatus Peregrinibacteria bacterium]|nr:30S ribosomal protein S5 [Candidatus Peregrinibacteria bacterium]